MTVQWKHVRVVAVSLAGAVVTLAIAPTVGQFFVSLADERGWYAHPSARVHAMLSALTSVTASPWFHWLAGGTIGFAAGAWLDALARRVGISGQTEAVSAEPPDLQITFDPINGDGRYFYWIEAPRQIAEDNKGRAVYGQIQLKEYCLRVTNNTSKTIKNVKAERIIWPHGKAPLYFVLSGGTTSVLHPGGSDYIKVCTVNEATSRPVLDPNITEMCVVVSAQDIKQVQKTVTLNAARTPAIALLD